MPASTVGNRTRKKGKPAAHLVSDNAAEFGWGNLTLAVQLLLPLALLAIVFAKKKIWIHPYPLLDTYLSVLCPSFSQQQRLLKWMSTRIPHTNNLPNKIAQYWQNGSLLCTLINTVVPGACPNPQKHWKKPPTHGQALAYKYLGVAPVLTEDEFNKQTLSSYSERKFIKYLLTIQEAINKISIEEDTLKFTSKYLARGMGLVIGEQNRPSYFYIYPNTGTNKMEDILVNIKGPYNTFGTEMITSNPKLLEIRDMVKFSKDLKNEQKKLTYQGNAQRSFFRSVSFDITPIMNLMSNKKNAGEIMVKIEMEEDRAKVIFLPKFSGIYELLLTNDGQHLQGSPFVVRIMKSTKEITNILQENPRFTNGKIERKIMNESISITDEFNMKFDTNNNTNSIENKSDDESVYQDSGIFDLSDTIIKKLDFEEEILEIPNEDELNVIPKLNGNDPKSMGDSQILETNDQKINEPLDSALIEENLEMIEDPKIIESKEDIFNEVDLQNNQDFENLYNKYTKNEQNIENNTKIDIKPKNKVKKIQPNPKISTKFIEVSDNISKTDFEILSNIPQFQKGRNITSVERIVEIFEKESSNTIGLSKSIKLQAPKTDESTQKLISAKTHHASPVFKDNIVQEATPIEVPAKVDTANLETRYTQISTKETRPILSKDFSVCLEDEENYDTNVKEIKNIFERKPENKNLNSRFATITKKRENLTETTKKLAKSLPNLHENTNSGDDDCEDEFLMRFKEKRNFWNNLILQNSNGSLNMSSSDISSSGNTKLLSKQYENVSQSTNSLNTQEKIIGNKWIRRKDELYKTNSLDLTYDDAKSEQKIRKVTRAASLYDKIKIFDKDFDCSKHTTLLKRTKEKSNLHQKTKSSEIPKPDSLTEVPNTTSNNQIEEDIHFADIMKERFEISRRYFCSLESLTTKPNLTRRHSMDSGPCPMRETLLQKGGSLKVLNVSDRFSLDNLYKDVVLNKFKNCSFKGGPNKDALVETLSSISSCENMDRSKDFVEEDDLNMQFFNIRKRLRKRRSIKSIFDVNY